MAVAWRMTSADRFSDGRTPKVRRLLRADAEAFRALRLEGLRDDPDAFSASWREEAAQSLEWFGDRLESGFVLAGSIDQARIDGMAGLHVPPTEKARHKGFLWGMYVRPDARRSGLARRLIDGVIAEARGRVEELRLGVGVYNQPAIACYRAAGFEITGLDPRAIKIGDRYVDELVMSIRFAAP